MGWIIGNYIFGLIGAFIRWLFYMFKKALLKKKDKINFMNVWLGSKRNDLTDDLSNNFANVMLGMIFFVIMAQIIIEFNW